MVWRCRRCRQLRWTFRFGYALARNSRLTSGSRDLQSILLRYSTFEQTTEATYNPRVVTVKPGLRSTIKASLTATPSGLAQVVATADGCEMFATTVDLGTSIRPRISINHDKLESGRPVPFFVDVISSGGDRMQLDAPVEVLLQATNALIMQPSGDWDTDTVILLKRGATSTPVIQVRPTGWSYRTAVIRAELRMTDDYVIGSAEEALSVVPSWIAALSMTLAGSTLFGLYRMLSPNRRSPRKKKKPTNRQRHRDLCHLGLRGILARSLGGARNRGRYDLESWVRPVGLSLRVCWTRRGDEATASRCRRLRLTTACSGRRCAPPLMLGVMFTSERRGDCVTRADCCGVPRPVKEG